eukprot:7006987-Ditylum_brightwellii.AAC.1
MGEMTAATSMGQEEPFLPFHKVAICKASTAVRASIMASASTGDGMEEEEDGWGERKVMGSPKKSEVEDKFLACNCEENALVLHLESVVKKKVCDVANDPAPFKL